MSTVNRTTATNQFDPASMGTFQGFQPTIRGNLQQFATDPLKSSFFQQNVGMATQQNQGAFQTGNQQFLQNLRAGGNVGNLSAFGQSQLGMRQRGLSAANAGSFMGLLNNANQLRFGATQQMAGYRPLQTGQTQTQTQSGLGSWLPQVAGAALGAINPVKGMFGGGGGMTQPGTSNAFFGGANNSPVGYGGLPGGGQGADPVNMGNPSFMNSMPQNSFFGQS